MTIKIGKSIPSLIFRFMEKNNELVILIMKIDEEGGVSYVEPIDLKFKRLSYSNDDAFNFPKDVSMNFGQLSDTNKIIFTNKLPYETEIEFEENISGIGHYKEIPRIKKGE